MIVSVEALAMNTGLPSNPIQSKTTERNLSISLNILQARWVKKREFLELASCERWHQGSVKLKCMCVNRLVYVPNRQGILSRVAFTRNRAFSQIVSILGFFLAYHLAVSPYCHSHHYWLKHRCPDCQYDSTGMMVPVDPDYYTRTFKKKGMSCKLRAALLLCYSC